MKFIGIDISKAVFDVAILENNSYKNKQFTNNQAGFSKLLKWAKSDKLTAIYCLEATGIYGLNLAKFLYANQQNIIVANPIKTNAFSKMEMSRNKTDKSDAQSIARYTKHIYDKKELDKNLFTPKNKEFERLQFLVTRLEQLGKMKSQETNRLDVSQDKAASKSIRAMLLNIEKQQLELKKEINKIVASSEELSKQVELLNTINGIGDITAWSILAYLGDIRLFDNAKQISSYAGLNPKIEQSGSSINRSRLSKMGNSRLRKSLYMPAIVATRYNPLMADLYARLLAKGKPKKLAIAAVMRKLLVIAYGVLKSEKPFDVNYANR